MASLGPRRCRRPMATHTGIRAATLQTTAGSNRRSKGKRLVIPRAAQPRTAECSGAALTTLARPGKQKPVQSRISRQLGMIGDGHDKALLHSNDA